MSSVCPKGRGGRGQAQRLCFSILDTQTRLQPGAFLFRSHQEDFSFSCQYPEKWKSISTSDKLKPLPRDLPPSLSWQQGDGHDHKLQQGRCISQKEWQKSPGCTIRSLGAHPGFPSHLQAQEPFLTTALHQSSFHTWPSVSASIPEYLYLTSLFYLQWFETPKDLHNSFFFYFGLDPQKTVMSLVIFYFFLQTDSSHTMSPPHSSSSTRALISNSLHFSFA